MLYHILGALSSALFLLTWYGLYKQLAAIDAKKQTNQVSTQNLSINQFASSFFAFYANFIFGIAIDPFNHYLVWTRFGALFFLVVILFRVFQERRGLLSSVVFVSTLLAFIGGIVSMAFRPFPDIAKLATDALMLIVTVVLVQGTLHQYWLLHKSKSIGNLSFTLIQSILIKDISTLMFAFTMPFAIAWPLLVLNGSSVIARGTLLLKMRLIQKA